MVAGGSEGYYCGGSRSYVGGEDDNDVDGSWDDLSYDDYNIAHKDDDDDEMQQP